MSTPPPAPTWHAPEPPARRGLPVGAWIGIGTAIIVTLVFGIGGAFVGYRIGYEIGMGLPDVDSGIAEPDPAPTEDVPDELAVGSLAGDFALDTNVTTRPSPSLNVSPIDGWESVETDDDTIQYYDDATQCFLDVSRGYAYTVSADDTDASSSGDAVDGYVAGMQDDDTLSDVALQGRSTGWLDLNDGAGRVQFQAARVTYSFTDDDSKWQSLVVTRVYVETGWASLAYLDCPIGTDAAVLASTTRVALGSLSVRG